MLLERLINPKPKTILLFVFFAFVFLLLPTVKNQSFGHLSVNYYETILLLLTIFGILLHAFGLNNLIYKNDVIKKENIIIATTFILLNTFHVNSPIDLLSSFLMLFFINFLLSSYQKEFPFNEVFSSSLILSLIIILNPIFILMYILFVVCSFIFNFSNWRCYIISFLGFSMPFIFYLIFLSLSTKEISDGCLFSLPELSFKQNELINFFKNSKNTIIVFSVIFIISILEFFSWLYKKSIRSRKSFFIILAMLVISIVISFFGNEGNWYIILSPLSVLIANYFTYTKKRNLANILFYVFIFTSLFYRWNIII